MYICLDAVDAEVLEVQGSSQGDERKERKQQPGLSHGGEHGDVWMWLKFLFRAHGATAAE